MGRTFNRLYDISYDRGLAIKRRRYQNMGRTMEEWRFVNDEFKFELYHWETKILTFNKQTDCIDYLWIQSVTDSRWINSALHTLDKHDLTTHYYPSRCVGSLENTKLFKNIEFERHCATYEELLMAQSEF